MTEKLSDIIAAYGITAEVHGGGASGREDFPNSRAYTVTLRRAGNGDGDHENNPAPTWAREEGLTTPYFMGSALEGEPTALDVLSCLLSDAASYDSAQDFEDWANDFGYDTDSRKAYALYEGIEEARGDLFEFLSSSDYQRHGPGDGDYLFRGEHYARFMDSDWEG